VYGEIIRGENGADFASKAVGGTGTVAESEVLGFYWSTA